MLRSVFALVTTLAVLAAATDTPCDGKLDVVFLMDATWSLTEAQFKQIKQSVEKTINGVKIGPEKTRVSLLTFNTKAKMHFWLDETKDAAGVIERLRSIEMNAGYDTHTHLAFAFVSEQIFKNKNGARCDIPRAVVLLTDGYPSNYQATQEESGKLLANGVEIFVVGAGSFDMYDVSEQVNIITGSEDNTALIGGEAKIIEKLNKLSKKACEAVPKTDVYTQKNYEESHSN